MNTVENYPPLRPSLLLDFANAGRVDPRLQCVRASTATCYGANGGLRTVAANVPRISYDPATGRCRGMLAEEGRTNRLLRATDMASGLSWVGGSGHECTAAPVGAPLPFRVSTAGLVSSSGWIQTLDIPAGVYTISVECARGDRDRIRFGFTSGADFSWIQADFVSGAVVIGVNAALVPISAIGIRPTAVGYRIWMTFTHPGGSGAYRVYAGSEVGVSGGYTYYGYPQLEEGSFPTSFIPTTTAQATRAADRIWLPGISLPSSGFTIFGEASSMWGGEYIAIMSDNVSALGNYVGLRHASYGSYINSVEGARSLAITPRPAGGATFKFAATVTNTPARSLAAVDGALSLSAGLESTADLAARNNLKIGATSSSVLGAMWIRSLAIYPAVLAANQLQRLTA